MSCSHLLILNRHVFLNTSNCRRGKYSYEWILCRTDIKHGCYCNMESRHTVQTGAAISLRVRDLLANQLVVRKTLLSHHSTKLCKVKSMNRTTFQAEFKGL